MRYRYDGPGPVQDPDTGEAVRPGGEREFAAEPTWGPWTALDAPQEAAEPAPEAAAPAAPAITLSAPKEG